MALFENFPYTNLHELNLDWLIRRMNEITEAQVISVNGETGEVILYENPTVEFPEVTLDHWSIVRLTNGTTRGIMFGNDNKAYIVHGNLMYQLYGASNPPPYPVTSVNGLTGDITLFADNTVRLPDIDNISLTNWNIFRELNNVFRGIQFNDDDTESIINGQNRYQIYTSRNPPPYPVRSVNNQTGDVELFTDTNGIVTFPEVNDPNISGWILKRDVNGTNCFITIYDDGTMSVSAGGYDYNVYTTKDTENDIIAIPNDANTDIWGLIRDTSEGSVGILFSNSDALTTPEAYIRYVDSSNVVHIEKLLTLNDIPSASGVVSFNGQTGVVVVKGSDLIISTTDTRTIAQGFSDLATSGNNIKSNVAYVENTATATQNIPAGAYVIWQNNPYISSQAISIGDTLSGSNLTAISAGGITNALYDRINNLIGTIHFGSNQTDLKTNLENNWTTAMPNGSIRFVQIASQYGDFYGYLSRYSSNYGSGVLTRYNGTSAIVTLSNGTVTVYDITKTL